MLCFYRVNGLFYYTMDGTAAALIYGSSDAHLVFFVIRSIANKLYFVVLFLIRIGLFFYSQMYALFVLTPKEHVFSDSNTLLFLKYCHYCIISVQISSSRKHLMLYNMNSAAGGDRSADHTV